MLTDNMRKEQRAKYLNHELTHEEYYLWLAKSIGYTQVHLFMSIPEKEIKASTDKWFNDIPLCRWDGIDPFMHVLARRAFTGSFHWSISDSVCVAKAIARQVRGF